MRGETSNERRHTDRQTDRQQNDTRRRILVGILVIQVQMKFHWYTSMQQRPIVEIDEWMKWNGSFLHIALRSPGLDLRYCFWINWRSSDHVSLIHRYFKGKWGGGGGGAGGPSGTIDHSPFVFPQHILKLFLLLLLLFLQTQNHRISPNLPLDVLFPLACCLWQNSCPPQDVQPVLPIFFLCAVPHILLFIHYIMHRY